jgi:hypothetical protein
VWGGKPALGSMMQSRSRSRELLAGPPADVFAGGVTHSCTHLTVLYNKACVATVVAASH